MSAHILIALFKKGADTLAGVPMERRSYRARGCFTFFSPLVLGSGYRGQIHVGCPRAVEISTGSKKKRNNLESPEEGASP
jgi:hypothetical protein